MKNFFLVVLAIFLFGCNDNEDKIGAEQIRQALLDMKSTYNGTLEAAVYHGAPIAKFENAQFVSRDSLSFMMPLGPIASSIQDEGVAAILNTVGQVELKAGYHFSRIDDGVEFASFGLIAKNITIAATGDTPAITIVFADIYGGEFFKNSHFMMFNVSPIELLVDGVKVDSFKQLVYHFSGVSK